MSQARIERHPILDIPAHPEMVPFTFEGRPLEGRRSEMISSALFANGIHVFGHHKRDGSPQGIFCANGQCAQCLVMADGVPVKSCITPVRPGMDVQPIEGLPELKADDDPVKARRPVPEVATDVLIVGGGPAGLTAAAELAAEGVSCIVCDDKQALGGKLSLQTHNFFGSVKECYAGTRGMDIGVLLDSKLREQKGIDIWTDSPAVGVFQDGLVGVVRQGVYTLVRPKAILVAAGAREKALAFAGADLPGVYGAGAFQTLVNRDLIKPSQRLFVVGGGNVGLIAAYHALQAGIDVVGLVEVLPQCGGYKVHRDKILRLGVPVYTSHTVLRAEGNGHVERVIVARVDEHFHPVPGTEMVFEADTVLVAVGLAPVNELTEEAKRLGMKVYSAGDSQEIAEASAAMFSGRIVARQMLKDLGKPVEVPPEWTKMLSMLRSKPGPVVGSYPTLPGLKVYPMLRCEQEIPCNPCTDVCVKDGIVIPEGNILGRPQFMGACVGCLKCVAICPGLAIVLVDRRHDPSGATAKVTVPWEMPDGLIAPGQSVVTTGREGERIGSGKVIRILTGKSLNRRKLVALEVPASEAELVAGIRIRDPTPRAPISDVRPAGDEELVLCRCERVTREMILDYIERTGTRDLNAVKAGLRCGMGPCGGKTCGELILRVFRELGIDPRSVAPPVLRPFTQEVPMRAFLEGGEDAART
jgi:NADPH-dependent 2,4-dienoyl-CoA reductase/sulfur reductase-like enzyme/ferredoxin